MKSEDDRQRSRMEEERKKGCLPGGCWEPCIFILPSSNLSRGHLYRPEPATVVQVHSNLTLTAVSFVIVNVRQKYISSKLAWYRCPLYPKPFVDAIFEFCFDGVRFDGNAANPFVKPALPGSSLKVW